MRIRATDQRFHQLKVKNPNILTIMIVNFKKSAPPKEVKEFLEKEILDTDFLLLNKEIPKLPKVIKL